jgi:transposase
MYARKRKNKSGSTSIFVVTSKRVEGMKNPQPIVVKSFGSSNDPKKIDALYEEARIFAANTKFTPFLRINDGADIKSCKVKTIGFKDVYGKLFDRYFSDMQLKKVDSQVLQELVFMRIAQPMSKLKTAEIAPDFNFTELTLNKIYKFMDSLSSENINKIKQHVFSNSKALLGNDNLNVLFYDLTTIYFENNTPSDLKQLGFSKDGKSQHVQISLALIVTEFGLPVGYEIFPGNTFEGKTLLPVLLKLRKDYNIKNVTIVADSAMLSSANLAELTKHDFNYIVAARTKNLTSSITKQLLATEDYTELNDDISYKTIKLDGVSLITCHSKKRAEKDRYERELTLQRLAKMLGKSVKDKLRGSLKKPYIKLSKQSTIMLDEQKLEEAKKFDGYFGFYTNTNVDAKMIVAQYRGLW